MKQFLASILLALIVIIAAGCKTAEVPVPQANENGDVSAQQESASVNVSANGSYAVVNKEELLKKSAVVVLGEIQRESVSSAGTKIEYTVRVQTLYAGALQGETFALNYEISAEEQEAHPLQQGDQCVFFLNEVDDRSGYFSDGFGIFRQGIHGIFANRRGYRINPLTLQEEIAAAKGAAAPAEKIYLDGALQPPKRTKAEIIRQSEAIYRARVVEKHPPQMTGEQETPNGFSQINQQVTRYSVEILDCLKGNADGIVSVRIANGIGLSQELILKGEDAQYRLAQPLQLFEPEVGQEYIFALNWREEPQRQFSGLYADAQTCFIKDAAGQFTNINGQTIDPDQLK